MNEHGYCPHCKADLDGKDIKQTFLDQGHTEETATEWASGYRGKKWGRAVGQYCIDRDRTIGWHCPDCKGYWDRE
jgi:hypothetical protein